MSDPETIAREIIENSEIDALVAELSRADYVEVLEIIHGDIDTRLTAARDELEHEEEQAKAKDGKKGTGR